MQIKTMEAEAVVSIFPDAAVESIPSVCTVRSGLPGGRGLLFRIPLDASSTAGLWQAVREGLLPASAFLEARSQFEKAAFQERLCPSARGLCLHVLALPGSLYPLVRPIVWAGSMASAYNDFASGVAAFSSSVLTAVLAAQTQRRSQPTLSALSANTASGELSSEELERRTLQALSSSLSETTAFDLGTLASSAWEFESVVEEFLPRTDDRPASRAAAVWCEAVQQRQSRQEGSQTPRGRAEEEERASLSSSSSPRIATPPCDAPSGEAAPTPDTPPLRRDQLTTSQVRLCQKILATAPSAQNGTSGPSSRLQENAMNLPVRQCQDAIRDFVGNPRKRVLVLQGETG